VSIFTKPLSQLETADLQELLDDGAVENVRLEFKLEVPTKDETLKKLSSFANTFGGYMVVGARASSTDGRIEELTGVDEKPGYKQTVVQWCFAGASPPLTVEVSDPIPVPAGGGKICYVVYTAESDVAPHFLNGRKGVYVRTDEFSSRFEPRLANEVELTHLLDRRRVIRERRTDLLRRCKRRFEKYAAKHSEKAESENRKPGACITVSVVPRFPAKPVVDQASLKRLIEQNTIIRQQLPFPKIHNPMLSQHESVIVLQDGDLSLFEANIWGVLFYAAEIELQDDPRVQSGIHLNHLIGCLLLFLRHADKMLRAFGYDGAILIETQLMSILGVPWLWFRNGRPQVKTGSVLDDEAIFAIESTTEVLRQSSDHVAAELLRYIGFSANWFELVDTPDKIENLIRLGYEYNFWSLPPEA